MLRVGSLFSGIGGFDLGLERAGGFRTVWFCEQDEFCQHVLAQHWPGVPCHPDITELRGADVEPVDVLCGGFPCQDLSYAGKGAGLAGARSGLWSEYARLIGELGPRYVVVENVSALLARGLGVVLADLAALGYDAEWDCIPASAVGAPHRRDRVWLVAYPQSERQPCRGEVPEGRGARGRRALVCAGPRADGRDFAGDRAAGSGDDRGDRVASSPRPVADTERAGLQGHRGRPLREGAAARGGAPMADTDCMAGAAPISGDGRCGAVPRPGTFERAFGCRGGVGDQWSVEPDVGRVADGVPARVDRLRSLGNALVPQIATWIGQRILDYEHGELRDAA